MDTFARVIDNRLRSTSQGGCGLLAVQGVPLFEFLEDPDFNLACVPVLGDCTNNFYGNPLVRLSVDGLHDLAERSLAQESHGSV